jgi:hypothetical protein
MRKMVHTGNVKNEYILDNAKVSAHCIVETVADGYRLRSLIEATVGGGREMPAPRRMLAASGKLIEPLNLRIRGPMIATI